MVQIGNNKSTAVVLPPTVGKVGAILFFMALFAAADTNRSGYEQFRKCHGNCVNGILHAIGMPIAVSGVFLIVRSASGSAIFSRCIHVTVTTAYLALYLRYERSALSPWLFYLLYLGIFEGVLTPLYQRPNWTRRHYLVLGAILTAFNVAALEVIGHGLYEHHHSYVDEFFNSVFHTPLYGVNSVLLSGGLVAPRADHVCW
jgi:uncharacterized membrane protein YGL010W